MGIKNYRINSFEDFIDRVGINYEDKRIRLYRGQKDNLPLCPKLYRLVMESNRKNEFQEIEKRIIEEFKKLAYICDSKIRDYNDWDVLAIAQHFGLPTRLLDWTSNPLAALWFSFEPEKNNNDDRIVWSLVVENEFLVDIEKEPPFEHRSVKVFKPKYLDTRISSQDAWFSIQNINFYKEGGNQPSPDDVKFEDHLEQFIFSNQLRTEILRKLDILGVNYFSLFPDLSGLCKNIEWREFK